jgi:hypothetical protein
MKNFLKENWWKIILVLCAVVVAIYYGYLTYRQYKIDNDSFYRVEIPKTDNGIPLGL